MIYSTAGYWSQGNINGCNLFYHGKTGGLFFENQNEVDEFVEAAPVSLMVYNVQKTTAN